MGANPTHLSIYVCYVSYLVKSSYLLLLTGIQVTLHTCDTFQTSFVLELVALSHFGLKLQMIVIMKAPLLLHNIELSTTHEGQNAKVLCVFENPASIPLFFVQYAYLFDHSTSPMAAAGPTPGEFTPNRVERWLFVKLMTSARDGQRSGFKGPRGSDSK